MPVSTNDSIPIIPASKAPKPKPDGRGRKPKYLFDSMKVGEAFEITADKLQSLRQTCSNKNRAQQGLPEEERKRWAAGPADDGKFYVWRVQ